jgi:hypothetical protein
MKVSYTMEDKMSKNTTDFLKIIALFTMLVDHVGYLFFPDQLVFRLIGRIAFPLFALCLVTGYHHTRDLRAYKRRLLLFGLLSQIPYHFFIPGRYNVILFFFIGLLALEHTTEKNPLPLLLAGLLTQSLKISYGFYGMMMLWILDNWLKTGNRKNLIVNSLILNGVFFAATGNPIQPFSLLALPLVFIEIKKDIRLPRSLAYVFYPVHMTLLLLIDALI